MASYSHGFQPRSNVPPPPSENPVIYEIVTGLWQCFAGCLDTLAHHLKNLLGMSPRQPLLASLAAMLARRLRANLQARRLVSAPHVLALVWVVVLLWGEQWTFHAAVSTGGCGWRQWETWPKGATPHRLVLVADPQLVDAHTYPGRPWPLSRLTVLLTDNYMRRSFGELQEQLRPDTIAFLGDLFDGGREWATDRGRFEDPTWTTRPEREQKHAKDWKKHYGEDYWMKEYSRFGGVFGLDGSDRTKNSDANNNDNNNEHDTSGGPKKSRMMLHLPGNHDLGFASEIQLAVRNRFEAFFGEGNRVDVLGNHTFVSVDTVSLSAASSDRASEPDVVPVWQPARQFLQNVTWAKRKAVARTLRQQHGLPEEGILFPHQLRDWKESMDVEQVRKGLVQGPKGAVTTDFPTVLLSHVPLYRPPGTPCGPLREHWPPSHPPNEQDGSYPAPDDRNAITVARGYQYQNVLNEGDSADLVTQIGNVVHVFSGDDHDYCEIQHDSRQQNVREITVKSFSMAMGVPTPAFLQVSLWNPVDAQGNSLNPGKTTLQTHLCLLPNQLATYARYAAMVVVSLVLLAVRAILVPVLHWTPFALEPETQKNGLPLYKAKVEDDEYGRTSRRVPSGSAAAATSYARGRSASGDIGLRPPPHSYRHNQHSSNNSSRRKSPTPTPNNRRHPTIQISDLDNDDYLSKYAKSSYNYPSYNNNNNNTWRPARRIPLWSAVHRFAVAVFATLRHPQASRRQTSHTLQVAGREMWTTSWRVAWMVVAYWVWLNWW